MALRDVLILLIMAAVTGAVIVVTGAVIVVTGGSIIAIIALAVGWVISLPAVRRERATR